MSRHRNPHATRPHFDRCRNKRFSAIERKRGPLINKEFDEGLTEAESRQLRRLDHDTDVWERPFSRWLMMDLEYFFERKKTNVG